MNACAGASSTSPWGAARLRVPLADLAELESPALTRLWREKMQALLERGQTSLGQ